LPGAQRRTGAGASVGGSLRVQLLRGRSGRAAEHNATPDRQDIRPPRSTRSRRPRVDRPGSTRRPESVPGVGARHRQHPSTVSVGRGSHWIEETTTRSRRRAVPTWLFTQNLLHYRAVWSMAPGIVVSRQ